MFSSTHRSRLMHKYTWWLHQMETFSVLLAVCARSSPVPGEFPAQRPVTRSFDIFFDLRLNKRLRKQSWGRWFETLSRPLWRHCNDITWLLRRKWLWSHPHWITFSVNLELNLTVGNYGISTWRLTKILPSPHCLRIGVTTDMRRAISKMLLSQNGRL